MRRTGGWCRWRLEEEEKENMEKKWVEEKTACERRQTSKKARRGGREAEEQIKWYGGRCRK